MILKKGMIDFSMKKIDLGKAPVVSTLFKLAIPSMIAQIVNMLYNFIDRIFVSGIESIGTDALASLGVCFPITLILSSFAALIGLGGAPLSSIKLGEGNKKDAERLFNQAFSTLFCIGIILSILVFIFAEQILLLFGCPDSCLPYALPYLKIYTLGTIFNLIALGLNPFINVQGYAISSMCSTLIGALLNIILDPIFIYVLNLGINGAALATIISQIASFIYVFSFFFRKKSSFKFNIKSFVPTKLILSVFVLGLSPFIMQLTESAIQIVFSICLKKATNGNSDYTAAMTILLSALQLISFPLNGFSNGAGPLVSYNYGARNEERVKKSIKVITIFALIYTSIFYSISMIYPQTYALIFSASENVIEIVAKYGRIFLMGTIMFFAQMALQNTFVALGQAKISIVLACLRKVILLIPLCIILSNFLGAQGVFLSEGISDITAGIITYTTFALYSPHVIKKRCQEKNTIAL